MKLLLIQPPIEDFYETAIRLQPIGLSYLKAALKKYLPETEVKIVDFHQGWGRKTLSVPKELEYLKDFYPYRDQGPFSTFHQYFRFGASKAEIAARIHEEKPDIVGISCLFSPYYREALQTAEISKSVSNARVIIGGSHVSAEPLSVLQHAAVDFIIQGEGERPLVELISALSLQKAPAKHAPLEWKSIAGLGFKVNSKTFLNPPGPNFPIDDLPPPDLGDFALETYQFEKRPLCFLVTSRSCPHHCSFCSVHATFGLDYRRNSVPRVLEEMQLRYKEGYRVFDFEDDNLTFYRREMLELCAAIPMLFPKQDIELVAMNGISYLSLDVEVLMAMRQAGFTHLNLALVSSDRSVLETTKRPHTVEKFLKVVAEAFELGFEITAYQILGLPFEKLGSMAQTLGFLAQQPVLMGASLFYMTPNSPIARQLGFLSSETDIFKARLTAMAIETPEFRREDLYTLFITTRIINFLKAQQTGGGTKNLDDLLEVDGVDHRSEMGLMLLRRLLQKRELCAYTRQGIFPLRRFNVELFFRVWNELKFIRTLDGGTLTLNTEAISRLEAPLLEFQPA